MAVFTAFAVPVVSAGARAPVAWCGAVAVALLAAVSAEAVRRGRTNAALRHRCAAQEAEFRRLLANQAAETARLAEVVLPDAVARLQRGEHPEQVLRASCSELEVDSQFQAAHQRVVRTFVDAVVAEEELRDSAQRAFVNIARRVQAIVHQQAQDLREMQHRHGNDAAVFGDLLHVDHGNSLIGRLADSIAVLGGARPGRQWLKNVTLFSVLRGAMSRILDYRRVDLHSVANVAVLGPTVEPLIHALAELLDNATRYSPPHTRVHLTATEVQSGIAVEIEDAGVGLTEEALNRAERVLAQASIGLDLTDLGEAPRLGLAVVGRLVRSNRFQVSLRPSAYGGVRAVLVVPRDVITTAPMPDTYPGAGLVSMPVPASVTVANQEEDEPVIAGRTANGLPQRRRRRNAAPLPRPARAGSAPAPTAVPVTAPETPAPADPPVQPGIWLAAFHSGVSGEAPTDGPVRRNGDGPLDESE
ncbi:hypothetical protein GCM10012280_17070 [Wenjunlia tyrosinilytica]|uniref:histidine kinase n=2 Tax=Wenjunlia tyrosinilytica TaxID=1544741 RepID=A0A917ZLP1_9ACTN|nr:hypothetical protein GCM10012280_17070 [Wenjunlia tyrosinilytica]